MGLALFVLPAEAIGKGWFVHLPGMACDDLCDQFDDRLPPLGFGGRPFDVEVGLHLVIDFAFGAGRHCLINPGFGVFNEINTEFAFFFFAVQSGAGVE